MRKNDSVEMLQKRILDIGTVESSSCTEKNLELPAWSDNADDDSQSEWEKGEVKVNEEVEEGKDEDEIKVLCKRLTTRKRRLVSQ